MTSKQLRKVRAGIWSCLALLALEGLSVAVWWACYNTPLGDVAIDVSLSLAEAPSSEVGWKA